MLVLNIMSEVKGMREFTGFKKGVNLGGWLSQCGEENYNEQHYSTFITSADIDKIAEMGVDHIRLPIDYNVVMTDSGEFIEHGFTYIDRTIADCRRHGLSLVLDLHKTAGFVFDNADDCQFFDNEQLQNIFCGLWVEFAKRYGDCNDIAFELLNEVTHPDVAEKWNAIALRTIKAIREISQSVKIIVGGIMNSSIKGLSLLDKPYDENIVFTYHFYSPMLFTHQKAYWVDTMPKDSGCEYPIAEREIAEKSERLFGNSFDEVFDKENTGLIGEKFFENMFASAVKVSEKYDVPLYCGEYGVIDNADPESTVRWFRDIHSVFEKLGIAHAVWTYKEKDFGITDEHYSSVYSEIVKLL